MEVSSALLQLELLVCDPSLLEDFHSAVVAISANDVDVQEPPTVEEAFVHVHVLVPGRGHY